jgi:RNA polymerase sigma factor for flagellar operon FliA
MKMTACYCKWLILDHLPQVELDDLIHAGTIGLIQAVDRYDESRGCLLQTIAAHRIRGALLDYLRQIDPLPRNIRRFQKRRDAAVAELTGPQLGDVAATN